MEKESNIGDWNVMAPFKFWKKITGNPVGSALATGALSAGAGYLASPFLMNQFAKLIAMNPAMSPEAKAQMFEKLKTDDSYRWKIALSMGLLGGGASVAHNLNPKLKGWGMLDWDAQKTDEAKESDKYYKSKYDFNENFSEPDTFGKESSHKKVAFNPKDANPLINHPTIPFKYSTELIWNDPYLDDNTKAKANAVFAQANPGKDSGLISTGDLVQGAVRAGLGYVGGAVVGGTLGKLFSLPQPMTQALSIGGGIALGIKNTGIL
jgi:hypothetical protein